MIAIMETIITEQWDQRHWEVALKTDKPIEAYSQIKQELENMKDSEDLNEMPQEQRDWYRS